MKYGIVYYKNTANLGDDILTYAGKKFLPQVDYYIDREAMDLFVPDEREYVATIINGFFLHFPFTFQVSPYILPFFIGIHFTRDAFIYHDYSYLDGYNKNYLQKYAPIGCRDYHTVNVLKNKGIEAYFSGCLTLTLEKFEKVKKNHDIILTDVSPKVKEYIEKLLPERKIESITHRLPPSLIGEEWNIREKRVEEYLKKYQSAALVITSRLHCALPSVALDTPTILVGKYDEDYNNRLASFSDYVITTSENDICNGKLDDFILKPKPIQEHREMVEQIKDKCHLFIQSVVNGNYDCRKLPEIEMYKKIYSDRVAFMREACFSLIDQKRYWEKQAFDLESVIRENT